MAKIERIAAALSLDGLAGDARSAFELAAGAGYSGVAIPTNHRELSPEALGETGRRHLMKTLGARGLGVASVRAAAPRGGLGDPATIDRTVENTRRALKLAGALGVKTVSMYAGAVGEGKEGESSVMAALKELAQEADAGGIALAVGAESLEKLGLVLAKVGYDGAKLNVLPAQGIAAGEDVVRQLELAAGRVGQFTAADAVKVGRSVRAAELGEGQVPWEEIIEMLRAQDFQGPMVVDVRELGEPGQAAEHAARVLRKLLGR